jgi:prephenate dehydrogenase
VTGAGNRIEKLVVIGVGLIGGSFALALKSAAGSERSWASGAAAPTSSSPGRAALSTVPSAIDSDWTRELAGADVVLSRRPSAQFPALFAALAGRLSAQAVSPTPAAPSRT